MAHCCMVYQCLSSSIGMQPGTQSTAAAVTCGADTIAIAIAIVWLQEQLLFFMAHLPQDGARVPLAPHLLWYCV